MRDQLPDLLGDDAARVELGGVRAHVAECASCREELAFLRRARASARIPRVDVGRIAAAIPPYRAQPAWARLARSPLARVAAVLVLAVGIVTVARQGTTPPVLPDTQAVVVRSQPAGELTLGTLSDLSETDLETLLEDLGDLEAVTPAEEDVVVLPSVGSGA